MASNPVGQRWDGTFQVSLSGIAVGLSPSGVGVGDFNGDGKPDMAVAIIVPTWRRAPGQRRWHILLLQTATTGTARRLRGHRRHERRRQGGIAVANTGIQYRVVLSWARRWNVAIGSDRRGRVGPPRLRRGADVNADGCTATLYRRRTVRTPRCPALAGTDGMFQQHHARSRLAPVRLRVVVADFDGSRPAGSC